MARTMGGWFTSALLLVVFGTSAWGASISGTVSNGSGKSGRIYLAVEYVNGGSSNLGTSIASAGAFTINGVQSGIPCTVRAFLDTQGNGIQHANDPIGLSSEVTATNGDVSVGTFAVTNPTPSAAQAPQVMVYPGNGGNLVLWQGGENDNGLPIADRYTVYWSTSATGTPLAGQKEVPSGDMDFFAHPGGSASLYYRVVASAGGTSASSGWIRGNAPAGTGSVTGKILFPGVTATGPLFVALADEATSPPRVHVVVVASPVSGGSYSASNVPAGTYTIYPILDLNNSGAFDTGDLGPAGNDDFGAKVTVTSGAVAAPDVTLTGENAVTRVNTGHGRHQMDGRTYENYSLQISAQSLRKQLVKVQVGSGPQLTGPIDLALERKQFRTWLNVPRPTVGDSYPITLTFADGTSQTVSKSVTGVLDAFPGALAPAGLVPYNGTPTFSWSTPSSAPAEYLYSLWLHQEGGNGGIWDAWGIPAGTTSLGYGSQGEVRQATLSDGATYQWTISVRDRNGNESQNQTSFTPTSAPALSGFSPAGGLAGSTVTISGINFSATPGQNTVRFNGVQATVSQASATSLRVTVPQGATSGPIQVTVGAKSGESADQFIVSAPISVQGVIRTTAEVPVAGARVELADDPGVFALTGADGGYTLQVFPEQDFALKVTGTGFVTTYSTRFFLNESLDLTPYPYHLYTLSQLRNDLGIAPGKGVAIGRVFNTSTAPFTPLAGATVSGTSSMLFGAPVPVSYFDGTSLTGSATYGNGLFLFRNLADSDGVQVNAAKPAWNFSGSHFEVRADSVTEGAVFGSTPPPFLGGFSPAAGKAGSSVTISGGNFGATPADNTVRFNGTSAQVTSASPTTLIVTVPAGAVSGAISVATAGGTANSGNQNFTMRHTLTASATGSAGALGTVTSAPVGISCRNSGCTAEFDQGTQVQLFATADGGSSFSAWSGACTGSGPCSFAMSGDKGVTAAFQKLLYLKNGANYYALLQEALDGAAGGDTVLAQARVFSDASLLFNRPGLQVTLKGGLDEAFLGSGGFTTLDGRLDLRGGTLRVQGLRIR